MENNRFIKFVTDNSLKKQRVKDLIRRQEILKRNGMWAEALKVAVEIEDEVMKEVDRQITDAIKYGESVDISSTDYKPEDRELFHLYILRLYVCMDIIESTVMSIESLLKKYDRTLIFNGYKDIIQFKNFSKEKLKAFSKTGSYLDMPEWGSACDDLEKMMASKVKRLYNLYNKRTND